MVHLESSQATMPIFRPTISSQSYKKAARKRFLNPCPITHNLLPSELEHILYTANGLVDSHFVFDQSKAYEFITVFSKSQAR